jgi:diacylglycerol kinase family enzyme
MKVFVISNPSAGKRFKQGLNLPDWITTDAQRVVYQETEHQGHGESLAKEACQQGFDTIIAAGGDGTIHEILNGVLRSQSHGVRMAILPMGTANDYAYSLAQRPRVQERFTQWVDVGAMTCNGQQRYFANVAGVGFPGRAAELARGMKRLPARLRYTLAILRCMGASYRTDPVRIDAQEPSSYLMISAAIGMREGSYPLTPDAKLDDGLFDLLLVGALRRRDIIRYFPRMIRGDIPTSDPRITTDRKSKLEIRSSAPIPLHLDGEDPWRVLGPPSASPEFQFELSVLPKAIAMELCADRS